MNLKDAIQVKTQYPERHAKYLVIRNNLLFTATPCYGMHAPWWVVMTMNGEVDPVVIEETDRWIPLKDIEQ